MIQIKPCKDRTETGTPITYFNHDSEVTHRNQLPINKPIRDLRNLLYIFWVNLKEINPMLSTHYQVNVKFSHLHELLLRAFPYRSRYPLYLFCLLEDKKGCRFYR